MHFYVLNNQDLNLVPLCTHLIQQHKLFVMPIPAAAIAAAIAVAGREVGVGADHGPEGLLEAAHDRPQLVAVLLRAEQPHRRASPQRLREGRRQQRGEEEVPPFFHLS